MAMEETFEDDDALSTGVALNTFPNPGMGELTAEEDEPLDIKELELAGDCATVLCAIPLLLPSSDKMGFSEMIPCPWLL
jgi:hypothetical protein